MRRFFIPSIPSGTTTDITGTDAHHLRHVLRLQPQDTIIVFDGTGDEYHARIISMDDQSVQVELLSPIENSIESHLDLTLAQAFLKEKKMDGLIRHLTELGVTRWIPFMARRSVPNPDPKRLQSRIQRWRKISLESLKQCGRSRPMAIDPPVSFQEALELSKPYDLKLIFWEKADLSQPSILQAGFRPGRVFMMIGPEGGFDPAEIRTAQAKEFQIAALGPRILRAETATLTAAVLAQYVFGDLGSKMS
jgi:16S rRNA (uracil1498-N3)-methyltransferase